MTQLRSFLAVVKTGSITVAADELVVTQPSVSAAVAALSREVGAPLTERTGRTIRTSAAGRAFAPYAADVIGLLDQGRRAAQEVVEARKREVRIAAVTTAGEHIVPPLMQAFAAGNPDVQLTLEVGNRGRVFEHAADHSADVAIGGRPPADGRLAGSAFMENEIVMIAPPGDPLAGRRRVPVDALGDRVWLLREEGSGTRVMNEQFLERHGLEPERLTLGSNGAIKQAARAGLGVSLQSRAAVALELEAGLLSELRLHVPLPKRDWYVLRSKVGPVRDVVVAFIDFVRTPAAKHAVDASRLPAPRRG